MKRGLATLAVMAMASTAWAGTLTTPHVTGDWTGWGGGEIAMVETGVGTDIWTANIGGFAPGERHEYKLTDGDWTTNIPVPGNSWFYADAAGNIELTYDGNTYASSWSPTTDRFGLDVDPGAWTAVGNWQNQLGGTDWTNNDPATAMDPLGGGVYRLVASLAPGNYDWKAVFTGTWDALSWDARSVNSSNWNFDIDAVNNTAVMMVNAFDGTARLRVVPEPTTLALLVFGGLALVRRR